MLASVRRLRPTRRGYAVAAIAVVGFALGALAGARSLNAVVVPALVGLVAGAAQLAGAGAPTLDRSDVHPGFPGETREVTVAVESALPCTVTESVARPLAVDADSHEPSVHVGHGGRFTYRVGLSERGGHRIGPATCRQTDTLGLFSRTTEPDGGTDVVVYPDVHAVESEDLGAVVRRLVGTERATFDQLREFAPGDTMRDIHWRASARHPREEYVVAEYRGRSEAAHPSVVGESGLGAADEMATTVASIATHLLDAGATVEVAVPRGRVVARPGQTAGLLRLLALTGDGRVEEADRAGADLAVRGEDGAATVTIDGREVEFARLSGEARGRGVGP